MGTFAGTVQPEQMNLILLCKEVFLISGSLYDNIDDDELLVLYISFTCLNRLMKGRWGGWRTYIYMSVSLYSTSQQDS